MEIGKIGSGGLMEMYSKMVLILYSPSQNFVASKASMVPLLTRNAGPLLGCVADKAC